jgi:hypothetical protein
MFAFMQVPFVRVAAFLETNPTSFSGVKFSADSTCFHAVR